MSSYHPKEENKQTKKTGWSTHLCDCDAAAKTNLEYGQITSVVVKRQTS